MSRKDWFSDGTPPLFPSFLPFAMGVRKWMKSRSKPQFKLPTAPPSATARDAPSSLPFARKTKDKRSAGSDASATNETAFEMSGFDTCVDDLPDEMLLRIFFSLGPRDLGSAAQVSRKWREIAEDNHLWKSLFRRARARHQLEASALEAANYAVELKQPVQSWKKAYKRNFHIEKSIFSFNGVSDGVRLVLDRTTYFLGEDSEGEVRLSGIVVVNVASEELSLHGVYVKINALQTTCKRVWDDRQRKLKLPLLKLRRAVMGSNEWRDRKKAKAALQKGTYRLSFSFGMPITDALGNNLPPTFFRAGSDFTYRIQYTASAVMSRPWPHSDLTSPKIELDMRQYSRERLRAIIAREDAKVAERRRAFLQGRQPLVSPAWERTLTKGFLGGGSLTLSVRLERTTFCLGDRVAIAMAIDASGCTSKAPKGIKVKLVERLEGIDCKAEIQRGHSECRLPVQPGEIRHVKLLYELRKNDVQGVSMLSNLLVKHCYLLCVELSIPFAVNPKLFTPIVILEPLRPRRSYEALDSGLRVGAATD